MRVPSSFRPCCIPNPPFLRFRLRVRLVGWLPPAAAGWRIPKKAAEKRKRRRPRPNQVRRSTLSLSSSSSSSSVGDNQLRRTDRRPKGEATTAAAISGSGVNAVAAADVNISGPTLPRECLFPSVASEDCRSRRHNVRIQRQ